jgi:hypothetical protein
VLQYEGYLNRHKIIKHGKLWKFELKCARISHYFEKRERIIFRRSLLRFFRMNGFLPKKLKQIMVGYHMIDCFGRVRGASLLGGFPRSNTCCKMKRRTWILVSSQIGAPVLKKT